MKCSPLYFVGLLLLIVSSIEKEIDPDTKYFIYNKVTNKRGKFIWKYFTCHMRLRF